MDKIVPKRGEVWWAVLDPTIGTEVGKTRPVIIISNNSANRLLSRVQIVPVTSNTNKVYLSETLILVNGTIAKAMGDQVRTLSKVRLGTFLDVLSGTDMEKVADILRLQLEL